MNFLTVYYDGGCGLCLRTRSWLEAEPQIIPLVFVDRRAASAQPIFESLGTSLERDELIVVANDGRAWQGDDAWIMVLYALDDFRAWSFRLAEPAHRPWLRQIVQMLSKHRIGLGRWLDRSTLSFDWILGQARRFPANPPGCALPGRLLNEGRGMHHSVDH